MCQPCGNWCCESDEPGECGCDGCIEEKCWSAGFQPGPTHWFDIGVLEAQRRPRRKIETVASI